MAVAVVAVSLAPSIVRTAVAGECGDFIDGVRVACDCGDIVVTDTRLAPSDPVLARRCPFDALTVRADRMAESITLDLAGLTLRGSNTGVGLLVEYGGADGALVIGGTPERPAQIVGFGTGFKTRAGGVLRALRDVRVEGSRYDGVSIRSQGTMVERLSSVRNGGYGIRVSGRGGRLLEVTASHNASTGIGLFARDVIVEAVTTDNGKHGLVNLGLANDLSAVVSERNGGYGVVVGGGRHRTAGMIVRDNAGGDVRRGDTVAVEKPPGTAR